MAWVRAKLPERCRQRAMLWVFPRFLVLSVGWVLNPYLPLTRGKTHCLANSLNRQPTHPPHFCLFFVFFATLFDRKYDEMGDPFPGAHDSSSPWCGLETSRSAIPCQMHIATRPFCDAFKGEREGEGEGEGEKEAEESKREGRGGRRKRRRRPMGGLLLSVKEESGKKKKDKKTTSTSSSKTSQSQSRGKNKNKNKNKKGGSGAGDGTSGAESGVIRTVLSMLAAALGLGPATAQPRKVLSFFAPETVECDNGGGPAKPIAINCFPYDGATVASTEVWGFELNNVPSPSGYLLPPEGEGEEEMQKEEGGDRGGGGEDDVCLSAKRASQLYSKAYKKATVVVVKRGTVEEWPVAWLQGKDPDEAELEQVREGKPIYSMGPDCPGQGGHRSGSTILALHVRGCDHDGLIVSLADDDTLCFFSGGRSLLRVPMPTSAILKQPRRKDGALGATVGSFAARAVSGGGLLGWVGVFCLRRQAGSVRVLRRKRVAHEHTTLNSTRHETTRCGIT